MSSGSVKAGVLVVGELNMDLILSGLVQFPEMGKEILADGMTLGMGSSSAIFASNLSVLGVPVRFTGRVGSDTFGDRIVGELSARGVDTRFIIRDELPTGITVAVSYLDDRAMVTFPGAMNTLKESDVSDEMLRGAAHLHVSSLFLQPGLKPGLARLLSRARQMGLTTSVDPQWDPAGQWDLDWGEILPLADVFLPNAAEITAITGKKDSGEALEVLKGTAGTIVIKNGRQGAVLWSKGVLRQQPAFLHEAVVDAIGAGDSFDAGFVSGLVAGRSLAECLELGAVCGAINTTAAGGTAAFKDRERLVRTALDQFNYRFHDL
jgi:sugar/nucleoside kinase (ribokinase family)